MPALPLHEAGKYVAAAYVVLFALVLIYVAIMATRLGRIERELGELLELTDERAPSKRRESPPPSAPARAADALKATAPSPAAAAADPAAPNPAMDATNPATATSSSATGTANHAAPKPATANPDPTAPDPLDLGRPRSSAL